MATSQTTSAGPAPEQPKAWELEPLAAAFDGYLGQSHATDSHPGASGVPYAMLRAMARVPLVAAVIETRVRQVAEHAIPQPDRYSPGFVIRLRDRSQRATSGSRKKSEEISRFLMTCGDPRLHSQRLTFEQFVSMLVRDSLTFDAAVFEPVPTRGGGLAGFVAVDASTIRRAQVNDLERRTGRRNPKTTGYVQIIDGEVKATWRSDELVYGIRRPRTWIGSLGYGWPEIEELLVTITRLLQAEAHNANFFRSGVRADALIGIKSKMDDRKWRHFLRSFHAMLSGAPGAHRTALIKLNPADNEGMTKLDLGRSNEEMQFGEWMSWQLRILCALYGMDPVELGYQYGNENQQQSLVGDSGAAKLAASRERGLRPLMRQVAGWINHGIIHRLDEDFEMVMAGIDALDRASELKQHTDALAIMTLNEVRAERDLPPLDLTEVKNPADLPLNQQLLQALGVVGGQGAESEGEEKGEQEAAPEALFGADDPAITEAKDRD